MVRTTINHYKVTEKIGEGGMGEVYRAIDTKLNRDVATDWKFFSFFLVSILFLTGHVRGQSNGDSPLTLYVSSGHTDQVLRYDGTTGDFLGVFAQGGGLDLPSGMTFSGSWVTTLIRYHLVR